MTEPRKPCVLNKRDLDTCERTNARVYVGRPSIFGNPFRADKYGHNEAVRLHREWAMSRDRFSFRNLVRSELAGKDLICWCAPASCHAYLLLAIANGWPLPPVEPDYSEPDRLF